MTFHSLTLTLKSLSHVRLFATLWTVAHQAPQSMEFFRQEYWSGLPFPSPEDLLNPGIKPASLTSPALAGGFFTSSTTWVKIQCHLGTLLLQSMQLLLLFSHI